MRTTEFGAGVDTSVLVRLLTGCPASLAESAKAFLAEMEVQGAPVFVSNLVVAEAYFACQYHYDIPKAEILSGLHTLLAQPTFHVREDLLELLAKPGLDTAKPGFVDRLIHTEYHQASLPLVTFEKAAAKLPAALILPLA